MSGRRRRKAEHTEDWERLLPLFEWPEQERYEAIPVRWCSSEIRWPSVPRRWASPKGCSTAGWTARGRRDGEPLRHPDRKTPGASARHKETHRRPPSRVPCLQPERDSEHSLRPLRSAAGLPHGRAGSPGGTLAAEDVAPLRSLPPNRRTSGTPDGHREAPLRKGGP